MQYNILGIIDQPYAKDSKENGGCHYQSLLEFLADECYSTPNTPNYRETVPS
jgi:hypothetical protein